MSGTILPQAGCLPACAPACASHADRRTCTGRWYWRSWDCRTAFAM